VVILTEGRTVSGLVTSLVPGREIKVKTDQGERVLAWKDVLHILRCDSPTALMWNPRPPCAVAARRAPPPDRSRQGEPRD
jgi:hypothetical protein